MFVKFRPRTTTTAVDLASYLARLEASCACLSVSFQLNGGLVGSSVGEGTRAVAMPLAAFTFLSVVNWFLRAMGVAVTAAMDSSAFMVRS